MEKGKVLRRVQQRLWFYHDCCLVSLDGSVVVPRLPKCRPSRANLKLCIQPNRLARRRYHHHDPTSWTSFSKSRLYMRTQAISGKLGSIRCLFSQFSRALAMHCSRTLPRGKSGHFCWKSLDLQVVHLQFCISNDILRLPWYKILQKIYY